MQEYLQEKIKSLENYFDWGKDSEQLAEIKSTIIGILENMRDRFEEKKKSQTNHILLSYPPQYPKTNDVNYVDAYNEALDDQIIYVENQIKLLQD